MIFFKVQKFKNTEILLNLQIYLFYTFYMYIESGSLPSNKTIYIQISKQT